MYSVSVTSRARKRTQRKGRTGTGEATAQFTPEPECETHFLGPKSSSHTLTIQTSTMVRDLGSEIYTNKKKSMTRV